MLSVINMYVIRIIIRLAYHTAAVGGVSVFVFRHATRFFWDPRKTCNVQLKLLIKRAGEHAKVVRM